MRVSSIICLLLFSFPGLLSAEEKKCLIPGVNFESIYTGEIFSKLSGGINNNKGAEYRGNFDFTAALDTENAGLWHGGFFYVYFENTHGEGISNEYVGDIQLLSNIDAHDFSQISEYIIYQSFMNDRLLLKLGKQDGNNDFNMTETAVEFINSSFGIMPNVLLPTFPDNALGAATFISIKENFSVSAGIFDGNGKGGKSGFDTAFNSDAVSVSVIETLIGYAPSRRGNLKLGVWRHGGTWQYMTSAKSKHQNTGAYIIIEQGILVEKESDKFCLDSFFQYGYADININKIPNYIGAGLRAQCLIPKRPDDSIGIGFASTGINQDISGMKTETAIEAYYLAKFKEVLIIQPDIQYIINPGGTGNSAFVMGARFYLNFGF